MNRIKLIIFLAGCLLIVIPAGCSDNREQSESQTDVTTSDVKEEAVQTMQKARAYSREQKEEYQKQLEEKISAFDRKLEELKAKAESMQPEGARVQYEKMLSALRQKQMEASAAFEELKNESGEAWAGMKDKMDRMIDDLQNAFDRTETQS